MIDYVISGIINIIGKRIGYVLLAFVLIFGLIINIKFNHNIELLIFNFLMINVGLFLLKINDKVL